MKKKYKQIVSLVGITTVILIVGHYALPNITRLSWMEIIRNNIEKDIETTAYFYTEVEEYPDFEKEVKRLISEKNNQEK